MGEIERLLPGTKVSDWSATAIAAALPTTHVDYAGYIAGGTGPVVSTDKFSFSNDARSAATSLSSGRAYVGAVSNNSIFAYVAGGSDSFPTAVDTVDKFTFPEHVRTTLSTGLSNAQKDAKGISNSGTAGYFAPLASSAIDKFLYSNDSRSTLSAVITFGGYTSAEGASNGSTAGYWGGGSASSGAYFNDYITKLTYSTEAISVLGATLWYPIQFVYGMSNSGVAGYFSGGSYNDGGWLVSNKYDKLTYSSETTATLAATMSTARYEGAGMADSGVAGYVMGGYSETTCDKLDFSTDTNSALAEGLSVNRQRSGGYANCESL
jgi:hypothetical protein